MASTRYEIGAGCKYWDEYGDEGDGGDKWGWWKIEEVCTD